MPHQRLLQGRDIEVKGLVDLFHIQDRGQLHTVQELAASEANLVHTEIPIKEHPGGYDPFIVTVTVIAVVLAVKLTQLGLGKD